jgi:hypothetical protein
MTDRLEFSITVDQNQFLPAGGTQVHAVVTVAASAAGPATGTAAGSVPKAVEIIIVDTSGSMSYDGKMPAARRAAAAAVDTLRDGVLFAVISGADRPEMVYPRTSELAEVGERSRHAAKQAIGRLVASGGTAIGSWLRLAGELVAGQQNAIRHAILLTDGENEHETEDELAAALRACAGAFVCDCRGVGTNWVVAELRKVASALLGSVDIVADPRDLAADFRSMIEASMGKSVGDVVLRVWTPQNARIGFVKQVLPSLEDLSGKRTEAGPQTGDYPIGAWGAESRDYHLFVEVPAQAMGRRLRAAWVKLVRPGRDGAADEVLASANVLAEWTDDETRSTPINNRVAHYTGQEELAAAVQEGLQAHKDGDHDTATARLGRAVALSHQSGNDAIAELLGRVVDVLDPVTGSVRLKRHVDRADEMSLDTRSTKTTRTRAPAGPASAGGGPAAPAPAGPPGAYPFELPGGYGAPPSQDGGLPWEYDEAAVPPATRSPADSFPVERQRRWLTAEGPSRASVGDRVNLLVRIVTDASAGTYSESVELRRFQVPAEGATVTILVQLSGGLVALDALEQQLVVPGRGNSDPLRFPFQVTQPGLQLIHVLAWVGGTFVGELAVEMSAESSAPPAPRVRREALLDQLRAVPGEVTLQVRLSPEGRYMFQLLSEQTIYDPITESLAGDPGGAVERTIAALQAQAEGRERQAARGLWLREAGVNLWEQMVPQVIKDQFWELHDDIKVFSIATDQDIIPWELLYPLTHTNDAGFLVEQFPVVRRVYGQRRAPIISLDPAVFVIPAGSPREAYHEIEEINRNLRDVLETGNGELLTGIEQLMTWVNSGRAGLLHFACHNSFNIGGAGSSIAMPDGGFSPMMLSSATATRALSSRSPLVFVNACRSAGAIYEYTRLTSWASQFMRAGAGAFLGTLWAVPSAPARHFAEAFYDACLYQQQRLGEAVHTARIAIRDTADPTWLAYTVYGDPAATIG